MRATNRLSASFLKTAPVGKHCDGARLWLVKRADGGAQWVLRVTVHGRRREMGLGGYPALTLAQARATAATWKSVAAAGRDPIKERAAEARAAMRVDGDTLRALIGASQQDAKFHRSFHAIFVLPRERMITNLLRRAQDRRELSPGRNVETMSILIHGAFRYRLLNRGVLDAQFAKEIVDETFA